MTHVTGRCCDTGVSRPDFDTHWVIIIILFGKSVDPVGNRQLGSSLRCWRAPLCDVPHCTFPPSSAEPLFHFDFDAICDATAATSTIAFSHFSNRAEQVTVASRCQMLITVAVQSIHSCYARNSSRRMHSISRRIVPPLLSPLSLSSLSLSLLSLSFPFSFLFLPI